MSRRPNPSESTAERNRATLKQLVKLESNKSCADCKRNKHPRWASWNLGIFICIRCSGIHRGMGTHISRVKSVDLDSWTDEQLQSMVRWGNARANKYWEHKLAEGHAPSEAKIENFIRTKYESKRWTMEGPIPDPSTLGGPEDDMPTAVATAPSRQATIERASSQRVAPPPQTTNRVPARPVADLIGGDSAPQRPNTTEPISRQAPVKAAAAPPRQTAPGDSLLGLDFLGGSSSAPPERPASTSGAGTTAAPRTDLKQSILSLYASAPKPAAQQPQHQRGPSGDAFGGFQSPPLTSPNQASSSGLGGMNDAFSSLSFTSTPSPPQQQTKPSAFSNLSGAATHRQTPSTTASSFGGGGSFFDPPTAKTPTQPPAPQRTQTQGSGFGDFFSATSPVTTAPPPNSSNAFGGGDLFDFSMPSQPAAPAPAPAPAAPKPTSDFSSAFNLSQQSQVTTQPKPAPTAAPAANLSDDPWGSADVWASNNAPAAAPSAPAPAPKPTASNGFASGDFGGWNDAPAAPKPAPQITQDDDFGGWSSAPAPAPAQSSTQQQQAPKPSGGFSANNDDLFSNVWG